MERLDGALGRHFDEKDERTLLQNAKCKMQRSESRASSHTRMLCRATHAFDESQMQKSESRDGGKARFKPYGLNVSEKSRFKALLGAFLPRGGRLYCRGGERRF